MSDEMNNNSFQPDVQGEQDSVTQSTETSQQATADTNVSAKREKSSGGFWQKVDKFYGVTARGSNFRTEIVAGIVTFLAMAYILTVNPNQYFYDSTSNSLWTSVFMATAFGAVIGTILMSVLAKLPLAQASGMGLNSMVGTIIGGGVGAFGYSFSFSLGNAMLMVLISGILFLLLSIVKIKGKTLRQLIFNGIPAGIRRAIPVGIGLFIAYIGFQNAGVIVANQYTQVSMVDLTNWGDGSTAKSAIVCLIGLILIAVLMHHNVKGAIILGILGATLVGIPLGVTDYKVILGNSDGISWKFWENFGNYFSSDKGVFGLAFTEGFDFPSGSVFTVIMLIITFCMIDMFDTMGTCVGCCSAAGLMDADGTPLNYDKIMLSDSIATCAGAVLGTSTVTTFVESGSGIAAGGKTGLTALVTAILFFL